MRYLIFTNNNTDDFLKIVAKLLPVGFVFSSKRLNNIDRIKKCVVNYLDNFRLPVYSYIVIGEIRNTDDGCKMVLHCSYDGYGDKITIDEFLTNVLPIW